MREHESVLPHCASLSTTYRVGRHGPANERQTSGCRWRSAVRTHERAYSLFATGRGPSRVTETVTAQGAVVSSGVGDRSATPDLRLVASPCFALNAPGPTTLATLLG